MALTEKIENLGIRALFTSIGAFRGAIIGPFIPLLSLGGAWNALKLHEERAEIAEQRNVPSSEIDFVYDREWRQFKNFKTEMKYEGGIAVLGTAFGLAAAGLSVLAARNGVSLDTTATIAEQAITNYLALTATLGAAVGAIQIHFADDF